MPTRWTDHIWRAVWALLAASIVVSLAASVLRETWPYLLIIGGLALVIRIALGAFGRRSEW